MPRTEQILRRANAHGVTTKREHLRRAVARFLRRIFDYSFYGAGAQIAIHSFVVIDWAKQWADVLPFAL